MSNALGIAATTAVMKEMLQRHFDGASDLTPVVGSVTVSALPPDRMVTGSAEPSALNLFLYMVTPNPGWRNADRASRDGSGGRLTNPPLALDLHYLLTAYGKESLHAEILLGYAMHLLHEMPVLDRQSIRDALSGSTVDTSVLPTAFQALSATDLADQVEQIKITPSTLSTEEMSRLWAALQAHYRLTTAYQASVVLIEARAATRSALPVLTRGERDPVTGRERGVIVEPSLIPPLPTLTAITPPSKQTVARLGETVTLEGHHLDGTGVSVRFEHPRRVDPIEMPLGANSDPTRIPVALPNTAADAVAWPAGPWNVTVTLVRPGETRPRTTNVMPIVLAPRLDLASPPTTITRDAATGAVTIHLAFTPQARPGQRVTLNAGGREALPASLTAATGVLDFVFPQLAAGPQWLRLRIDGADSVLVDRSTSPPTFDLTQRVVVP